MQNKKMRIQIREEGKCYNINHLAEVLTVSRLVLVRWVKEGIVPVGSKDGKFTRADVEGIFQRLNHRPTIKWERNQKKRWNINIQCELHQQCGGIFVIEKGLKDVDMTNSVKEHGLWSTQGMNNHEHMVDFVKNPIYQMILAKEWLRHKLRILCKMKLQGTVILYWNGAVDSTVCIYMMRRINNKFLKDFDKYLRMKSVNVRFVSDPSEV